MPTSTRRPRWGTIAGTAAGIVALSVAAVGIGSLTAGAQDDPTPADPEPIVEPDEASDADEAPGLDDEDGWEAFESCVDEALGIEGPGDFDELDLDDDFEAAEAACADLLPEDLRAELDAWTAYDDCFAAELGFDPGTSFDVDGAEPDDAAFETADEACAEELPDELRAEIEALDAAFADFDACLAEQGLDMGFDEGDHPSIVTIEGPEGFRLVEFGDEPGTVTISGTTDELSVETSGGATVVGEAELDELFAGEEAAFEACESRLPDDVLMDGGFMMDDGFIGGELFEVPIG